MRSLRIGASPSSPLRHHRTELPCLVRRAQELLAERADASVLPWLELQELTFEARLGALSLSLSCGDRFLLKILENKEDRYMTGNYIG